MINSVLEGYDGERRSAARIMNVWRVNIMIEPINCNESLIMLNDLSHSTAPVDE